MLQKCFYFAMCRNLDFRKKKCGGTGQGEFGFLLSVMAHTCYTLALGRLRQGECQPRLHSEWVRWYLCQNQTEKFLLSPRKCTFLQGLYLVPALHRTVWMWADLVCALTSNERIKWDILEPRMSSKFLKCAGRSGTETTVCCPLYQISRHEST